MALIEIYHVVADMLPVAEGEEIIEGQCVKLNTLGQCVLCDVAGERVYGMAGDTQSDDTAGTAYSDSIVMGADGALARNTSNRVSDFYNETGASQRITVYTSGGKFATDQFVGTAIQGAELLYTDANGMLTETAGAGNVVGMSTGIPGAFASGVPGVDTDSDSEWPNSISLGDYVTFKLLI